MSIYYQLKEDAPMTARGLMDTEGKRYQVISSNLNEMKRRDVTTEVGRDGQVKLWGLTDELTEDEPKRIVETETVVEEVPQEETFEEVIYRNRGLIGMTSIGLVTGPTMSIFGGFGNLPVLVTVVSLTGLVTVLYLSVKEVWTNGE